MPHYLTNQFVLFPFSSLFRTFIHSNHNNLLCSPHLQMLIQLQSKYLAIFELELELPAIEPWIVLVDDAMVVGADDNDVRGVVVLRTCEIVGGVPAKVIKKIEIIYR